MSTALTGSNAQCRGARSRRPRRAPPVPDEGQAAPSAIHRARSATVSSESRFFGGILTSSWVCRIAWISRLCSGSPTDDRRPAIAALEQRLARPDRQAAAGLLAAMARQALRRQHRPDLQLEEGLARIVGGGRAPATSGVPAVPGRRVEPSRRLLGVDLGRAARRAGSCNHGPGRASGSTKVTQGCNA